MATNDKAADADALGGDATLCKTEAKEMFGLTDRDLAQLSYTEKRNPHYRSGPPMKLYRLEDLQALVATPEVQARLERRSPESIAARESKREAKLRRRYPSLKDALPAACESMFNLNRYAKHRSCRQQDEIYDLKNGLIELLYRSGYCVECVIHERTQPARTCFACGGTGSFDEFDFDDGSDDGICRRCDGTGEYRSAQTLRDVAFRFDVDGNTYAWHQPEPVVSFAYSATGVEPGKPTTEKPIEMKAAQLTKGKHILRYVLQMWAAETRASKPMANELTPTILAKGLDARGGATGPFARHGLAAGDKASKARGK